MTFGLSHRPIFTLCLQPGLSLTLARPSRVSCSHLNFAVRNYATRQKNRATATSSSGNSKSSKKTPTKPAAIGDATVSPKSSQQLTEEEQLAQVERILSLSDRMPTVDVWGQRVDTLDVIIPSSTRLTNRKNYPTWRAMFDQFIQNRVNNLKNLTSLLSLAQRNAIPGIDLSETTRLQRYITQWPWRIFTTTSVATGSWLEALRQSAVKTYTQLNSALARGDDKTIKELSVSAYKEQIMRLRKKQYPHYTYLWRLHREVTPARVLSVRASEGYLGTEEPKFGNRMLVQALIRVDIEQSLEIYDRQGNPVHSRSNHVANTDSGKFPAERRRVIEYLIFEKRMWYDGPWVIREQLWEHPKRISTT